MSAEINPPTDDDALVTGDAHVMRNGAFVTVDEEAAAGVAPVVAPVVEPAVAPAVPAVPDALSEVPPDVPPEAVAEVPEAVGEGLPLAAVAALPLAASPEPPPPHAAKVSKTKQIEELNNAVFFI
ncbi:hypothetical protein [Caballeronia sp. DA-9]|uniref:hypothetical protein n=1 Tax=Caballeronia sp. DA-9 TaxID=3436237 RepID=UPI003F67AD33